MIRLKPAGIGGEIRSSLGTNLSFIKVPKGKMLHFSAARHSYSSNAQEFVVSFRWKLFHLCLLITLLPLSFQALAQNASSPLNQYFYNKATFPTGNFPLSVAIADLN